MKRKLLCGLAFASVSMSVSSAATYVDGSSPELAWYSPVVQHVMSPATPSGIFWYDELQGLGSPFQAYADMAIDGGGYTLGVVSLDSAPAASITISATTGSVSAPFVSSHTVDIAYLGLDQDAEIFYAVKSAGSTIFMGKYFGRFDTVNPVFTTFTDTMGLNGQLSSTFDFHRPDRNYDVAIYVRESSSPTPRAIPEPSAIALTVLASGLLLSGRKR